MASGYRFLPIVVSICSKMIKYLLVTGFYLVLVLHVGNRVHTY